MASLLPIFIFGLVFGSVYMFTWQLYPAGSRRIKDYHIKKAKESAQVIDDMFMTVPERRRLTLIHVLTPVILGAAAFFIFKGHLLLTIVAVVLGIILPTFILRRKLARRKEKFRCQLIDGLIILISCLKGGLGFLQSLEVVQEEMPAPMSEEFALMLREHKMGVSLEESLERLNKRMPSHELNLVTTATLFSRETGGDIANVFSKMVNSFRETANILERVKTLTIQGKLQGIIMSLLPVAFVLIVQFTNPDHLKIMFEHPLGRTLLWVALGLQIMGSLLIWHLSKVDV